MSSKGYPRLPPRPTGPNVEVETAISLKRSVSSYRGHLTCVYDELDGLMRINAFKEAVPRKSSLDRIFVNYQEASLKLIRMSCVQLSERDAIVAEYERQSDKKARFDENYIRWISMSEDGGKSEIEMELRAMSSIHPPSTRPRSGVSVRSSSQRSTASKAKVALAHHRLKQVEEEQRLLRRRRVLEREIEDLDMEKQIHEARGEVDRAVLESRLYEGDDEESDLTSEKLSRLDKETQSSRRAVERYLDSCEEDFERLAQDVDFKIDEREYVDASRAKTSAAGAKSYSSDGQLQQLLEYQRDTLQLMALGVDMPKREFLQFDGNPANYPRFIKNFEVNIEKRIKDNNARLSYLIQFCSGKAKEAIESCVILPEERGYEEAKEILKKNFGESHAVVRALIEKVVKGPQIKANDPEKLLQLARDMKNCLLNAKQVKYSADLDSMDNMEKVVKRLAVHLQAKWADESGTLMTHGIEPIFSYLADFVEKKAAVANTAFGKLVGMKPGSESTDKSKVKVTSSPRNVFATRDASIVEATGRRKLVNQPSVESSKSEVNGCLYCHKNHPLERCFKFKNKDYQERKDFVRKEKLCDNCLRKNHTAWNCRSTPACCVSGCKKSHHSLLHPTAIQENQRMQENASSEFPGKSSVVEPNSATQSGGCGATSHVRRSRICMKIVPVKVSGVNGSTEVETYAFLDNGSDTTLCLNELVEQLQLSGEPTNFTLSTVSGSDVKSGNEIQLQVKSLDNDECIVLDRVLSVDHMPISERSIARNEDVHKWSHLQDLQFPTLDEKRVTILIGTDVPEAHWNLEQRIGQRKQPYAVRTLLGWTLVGPVDRSNRNEPQVHFINTQQEEVTVLLERMYNADFKDTSQAKDVMSLDDRRALKAMQSSVRLVDGHYQLGLPWRQGAPVLPNNRSLVEKRLQLLKKRLERDPVLHSKYKDTMDEYIRNNHARQIPQEELNSEGLCVWYLPHHPVVHQQKPHKVRVVFDCAAKFCNVSLNDQLLKGPDLTNNLVGVLLRFREHQIAIMADIEKMFHQVRVSIDDCNALRFLWWTDGDLSRQPTEHQMLVHVFGAKSSPSCSTFALKRTAEDNKNIFSQQAIDTVNQNFYVDDCLKSVTSVDEAIQLVSELSVMLSKGGFHLTKWISNNRDVMAAIPEDERAKSVKDLDLEKLPVDRALGMEWNIENDTISFRVADKPILNTRRGILSMTSSIYDPLGFVAPIVLPVKCLLQDLCKMNFGWDDMIPNEYLSKWQEWLQYLPKLKDVSVPRCLKPADFRGTLCSVQIHNFSDASESGYGAVSYLRLVDVNGRIHCGILLAKARVAPLKRVTVPRLELTAATIAVKLYKTIQYELNLQDEENVFFWRDSMIVLQYILNTERSFKTFVANRIATIHEATRPCQWRHVSSESNPADCVSRGFKSSDLDRLKEWHKGPEFLRMKEENWPRQPSQLPVIQNDDQEIKKVTSHTCTTSKEDSLSTLLRRHSSWYALQKAVAWLLRFKRFLLCKKSRLALKQLDCSYLKVAEIKSATEEIVKIVQRESFPEEIRAIHRSSASNQPCKLPKDSSLRKLGIIMLDGILCVKGRLQLAELSDSVKHPMILPSRHHVTDIIINYYHSHGHVGPSQVLASLRRKFWILRGPSSVKRITSRCLSCRRWNARPGEQIMAPLPSPRVRPGNPPFSSVGIDYFGPIYVKVKRSTVKRYGCVFTCLAIRAVHIEVSHDLSSDSFIQAFTRFVSRRGPPLEIFSDNGTNFKGAESEIKTALKGWNQQLIQDRMCERGAQWYFNAPSASHAGGVWERMIRSIRSILRHLLKEQLVNDETLLTFLAEVEKILNDRPLIRPSDSPQDLEVLTPSMLLLNRPNSCSPPGKFVEMDRYTKRWKQAQYLANIFWKRWTKEYLPILQQRQKWLVPRRNFSAGDLVLVVDESVPRGRWMKGIIEETFPDRYGTLRQVLVRTATNRLHRDIRKLTLLEGQIQEL